MKEFKYGSYGYIAKKDMQRAKQSIVNGDAGLASFNAQQALEKIFKQYIMSTQVGVDNTLLLKTHKLKKLYHAIKNDLHIDNCMVVLSALTDSYYECRYPGEDYFEFSLEDATDYVKQAEYIFDLIESKLLNNCAETTNEF